MTDHPTPVDMILLLQTFAVFNGCTLACDTTPEGAMGVGEEGSPGWWFIPATEWHAIYGKAV